MLRILYLHDIAVSRMNRFCKDFPTQCNYDTVGKKHNALAHVFYTYTLM